LLSLYLRICLRPRNPYSPSLHTVYLFPQGRGGEERRVEPERRFGEQQFTNGSKLPT
jgi:hypothetical protein